MSALRLQYIAAAVLFALLLPAMLETGGSRLPFYYSPDGEVHAVGSLAGAKQPRRIHAIGDKLPIEVGAVLRNTPSPIYVLTDRGLEQMRLIPNLALSVLYDFKYYVIIAFMLILCGVWFLDSSRDIHLALICFTTAALLVARFMSLAYHQYLPFFQATLVLLPPALLNAGLRTTGKEVRGGLLLGELVIVAFMGLVLYAGRDNPTSIRNLRDAARLMAAAALLIVIALQVHNALQSSGDPIDRTKRWALAIGSLFGALLPLVLYGLRHHWAGDTDPLLMIFLLLTIFPVTLLYGTYRIQLVPFQFVLNQSLMVGLVTLALVTLFSAVLFAHSLLPARRYRLAMDRAPDLHLDPGLFPGSSPTQDRRTLSKTHRPAGHKSNRKPGATLRRTFGPADLACRGRALRE